MVIIVYTACMGGYDRLRPIVPLDGARYVAFLDMDQDVEGWERQLVPEPKDPRRAARWFKCMSHLFFADATEIIWIDSSFRLEVPPELIVDQAFTNGGHLAAYRHPSRDCAYAEAERCVEKGKDRPEVLRAQEAAYQIAGFPQHYGLVETGLLIRRNTPEVRAVNEAWWRELRLRSGRDQVSLPFVCWKLGLQWNILEGSLIVSPWLTFVPHAGPGGYSPRQGIVVE